MITSQDQLGRTVSVPFPPRRIISVVPSQTELLHDLGLDAEVAGITKFCVHPAGWLKKKTRVGGTKNLHVDLIRSLQPDLILANREENTREQLEALMPEFPVWVSDITTLADATAMIRSVGLLTGTEARAAEIVAGIEAGFGQMTGKEAAPKPRAAYLIWHRPWMAAGDGTFIQEMMRYCGLENCLGHLARYPVLSPGQLRGSGCELVLLSSEPFPFREKHAAEVRSLLPSAKTLFVDGEMFSWYGSRLLKAPAYLREVQERALQVLQRGHPGKGQ